VFVHHIGGYSFRRGKIDAHLRMDLNRRQFIASIKPFQEAADGPLVSVVMTTFNRNGLLAKALRSVIGQSYRNWEAVVVNDGGAPVRDVIDGFGDQRIRLFEREHAGRAPALNFALANIKGSLVAYLDDDDLWRANHLGVLVAAQRESGAQMVYSSAIEHLSRRRGDEVEILDSRVRSEEFSLDRLLDVNQMPNCCVLHEATLIADVGLFDERLTSLEDWDYWRRIAATNEIVHVPAVTAEFNVWLDFSSRNGLMVRNAKRYIHDVRAISLKPVSAGETSEWMRIRGNRLIAFGLTEEGRALLTLASDRNPLNPHAICDLIALERRSGRSPSPAMVARLETAANWHAQEYGLWSVLASELIAMGDHRKAEDALALALVTRQNDSQAAEAYIRLSECYAQQGYTDSAGACWAKAAELRDPKLRVKGAGRLLRPRLARLVYQARQSYRIRGLRASARSAIRLASARVWRLAAGPG
jgi:glycosyltransferase involved in cell wall biosynthesis